MRTISPEAGMCTAYRWKYHWVDSRSVGFSSATTRAPRGLRCSVNRLIAPPLPAASRPSKTTTTFRPDALTCFCSLSSSICSSRLVVSYSRTRSFLSYG